MNGPSETPLHDKRLTLSDIEVTWTERGIERSASGALIARLLYEASFEGRLQSLPVT